MNIYGMTPQKLEEYFTKNGENPAKAAIVFDGIYRRGVTEFAQLGLSQRVTDRLSKDFALSLPEIVEKLDSSDTAKLLLKLSDGEYVAKDVTVRVDRVEGARVVVRRIG